MDQPTTDLVQAINLYTDKIIAHTHTHPFIRNVLAQCRAILIHHPETAKLLELVRKRENLTSQLMSSKLTGVPVDLCADPWPMMTIERVLVVTMGELEEVTEARRKLQEDIETFEMWEDPNHKT